MGSPKITGLKMRNMKALFAILLAVASNLTQVSSSRKTPDHYGVRIGHRVVSVVDEKYLSVCIDMNTLKYKWENLDFNSVKIQTLASGLAPSYLRFGGTTSGYFYFDPNDDPENLSTYLTDQTKFPMTKADISKLYDFTESVGWRLLLDLNALQRKDGKWEPSNTMELLEYMASTDRMANLDLQLGNEPNSYNYTYGTFITATQLAKDFLLLQDLIKTSPTLSKKCCGCKFVGPDITNPRIPKSKRPKRNLISGPYLKEYLQNVNGSIDAITWHHYYDNGRTATVDDYLSADILDSLQDMIDIIQDVTRTTGYQDSPLWLGETSSSFGGGAEALSDRYAAGFRWLDKLGLSAVNGLGAVMRQSFVRGRYALLYANTFDPSPDYWLSWIYKRLVGTRVLNVRVSDKKRNVRLYAHCTSQRSGYPEGSVVMYGMNLNDEAVLLQVGRQISTDRVDVYMLTPPGGDLHSKYVELNGVMLKMVDEATLPDLVPVLSSGDSLPMNPHSMAFYVFKNAHFTPCL